MRRGRQAKRAVLCHGWHLLGTRSYVTCITERVTAENRRRREAHVGRVLGRIEKDMRTIDPSFIYIRESTQIQPDYHPPLRRVCVMLLGILCYI